MMISNYTMKKIIICTLVTVSLAGCIQRGHYNNPSNPSEDAAQMLKASRKANVDNPTGIPDKLEDMEAMINNASRHINRSAFSPSQQALCDVKMPQDVQTILPSRFKSAGVTDAMMKDPMYQRATKLFASMTTVACYNGAADAKRGNIDASIAKQATLAEARKQVLTQDDEMSIMGMELGISAYHTGYISK